MTEVDPDPLRTPSPSAAELARLAGDPQAQAVLNGTMRMHGLLVAQYDVISEARWLRIARAIQTAPPVAAAGGTMKSLRISFALAAAALLLMGLWMWTEIPIANPLVLPDGRALGVSSRRLADGVRITSADGAIAVTAVGDVEVAQTDGRDTGCAQNIVLHHGTVAVQVRPGRSDRFALRTERGDFVVKGTAFQVSSHAAGTTLRVGSGAVAWRLADHDLELLVKTGHGLRLHGDFNKEHGLLGRYRGVLDQSGGLVLVRIDPALDFSWTPTARPQGFGQKFSITWTGALVPPRTGRYRFSFRCDDKVSCWLDGTRLVNFTKDPATGSEPDETWTSAVPLTGGTAVPIRVELVEYGSHAHIQVAWQIDDGQVVTIPASAFRPRPPP